MNRPPAAPYNPPMSHAELLESLEHLDNAARLAVIERATRLVRQSLPAPPAGPTVDERMRAAALEAKTFYKPGGELAEWSEFVDDEVLDDTTPG